ncbi:hypothetical protein [Thermodesulfatator atlanticus]|uniref:hypothetical protein n=1 Tax=Thermodesulfatator atlanticus TaxID=501497 RepID=UPI0003B42207|nr:hypothetical protein [Thermodesulfatator atlanticus]
MPDDIKAPFAITPAYLRVENASERLPRERQQSSKKKAKTKTTKEKPKISLPGKGKHIDIKV